MLFRSAIAETQVPGLEMHSLTPGEQLVVRAAAAEHATIAEQCDSNVASKSREGLIAIVKRILGWDDEDDENQGIW
mgnify:CR=1 FL=1